MVLLFCLSLVAFMLFVVPRDAYRGDFKLVILLILAYTLGLLALLFYAPASKGSFLWFDLAPLSFMVFWVIKRPWSYPLLQKFNLIEFELVYRILFLLLFYFYLYIRPVPLSFVGNLTFFSFVITILLTIAIVVSGIWTAKRLNFLTFCWRKINPKETYIISVYMLFFVALGQEFLYRGLIYHFLLQFNPLPGILFPLLFSSIIFGLSHINYAGWKMVIIATLAGLCYGLVYILTDSLICPIVCHTLTNLVWKLFTRMS